MARPKSDPGKRERILASAMKVFARKGFAVARVSDVAREAGVANFIDLQLAGPWGAGERLYRAGPLQPGAPTQGYHLPFTAVALVLGQGGAPLAMLTCLATVLVAAYAGTGTAFVLDRMLRRSPHPVVSDSFTF